MNSHTHEQIYIKLHKFWKQTYTRMKLLTIPDHQDFIQKIRDLVISIKQQHQNAKNKPSKDVFYKTLMNINYMLNDIFKIREEIIFKSSQMLKKIDEKLLLKDEIEFYRGLHRSFRGYQNSKSIILNDISIQPLKKIKIFNDDNKSIKKDINQESILANRDDIDEIYDESLIDEEEQSIDNFSVQNHKPIKKVEFEKSISLNNKTSSVDEDNNNITKNGHKNSKNIDYVSIRINQTINPLVAEDMKIYGPFISEDISYMPRKNAEILIEEAMATLINF